MFKQTTFFFFFLWSVLQGLTQTMHDVFITKPVNLYVLIAFNVFYACNLKSKSLP